MRKISYIIALAAIIVCGVGRAEATEWRFRHYTDMEGLSSNTVQCIYQDSKGYIWAGTSDGLNRFNSNDFTTFFADYRRESSLTNDNIYCIASENSDNDDRLWIGTMTGVEIFDVQTGEFKPLPIVVGGEEIKTLVFTMAADHAGNMWIGTLGDGLLRYNVQSGEFVQWDNRSHPQIFERNTVAKIITDNEHNVWIALGGGYICRYDATRGELVPLKVEDRFTKRPISRISTMFADIMGNIWVAGMAGDLYMLDTARMQFTRNEPTQGGSRIRTIEEREPGTLLLGTEQGLVSFNVRQRKFTTEDNGRTGEATGLRDGFIHSMICDRDGGLWVGTYYGGLNYMPPGQDIFFSPEIPEACGKIISCFCENADGRIWVGSDDGGLSLYNPTTQEYKAVVVDYKNPNLNIHSLCIHDRALWVGTITNGLYRMDLATGIARHIAMSEGEDYDVYSLLADTSGQLWVGTMRNICRYNPATQCVERVFDTNYNGRVANICEDGEGVVWFATSGSGLIRYTPQSGEFEHPHIVGEQNMPPHISALAVENDDLWIGSQGYGLLRYDLTDKSLTRVFDDEKYGISKISQILVGGGNLGLWLTTNNGLINYLNNEAEPKIVRYTSENGLSANIFNANSGIKSAAGYIYVGSNNGIDCFFPYDLQQHRLATSAEVVLSELMILQSNKSGDKWTTYASVPKQGLRIRSNKLSFSLSFIALNYAAPLRTVYRYKLENFNNEWTVTNPYMSPGVKRVSYTNLTPATYRFVVCASLGGDTFGNETSFEITILPPWWMTRGMIMVYVLVVFALMLVVILLIRRRIASQHREQIDALMHKNNLEILKTKFERFTDIATEIYTPLSLIIAPAENIARQKGLDSETRNDAEMIRQNCNKLLKLVDSISEIDPSTKPDAERLATNVTESEVAEIAEAMESEASQPIAELPPLPVSEDGVECKASLLLVEKDEEFISFFIRYFSARYNIHSVGNGNEALESLEKSRYDLILAAWRLPDMSGKEFCEKIRADESINDIPLLILSKDGSAASKSAALAAGADLCIAKWASPDLTIRQIHTIIAKRNELREKYSKMPYVQNGKDNKSMIENRFMAQVNEYVKANIANPAITVEDIASAVNMSRTLFFTRIKQVTGLTPNEFLRTTRLKVAAELLAGDNKLRVTEICYMVGFSSTSYFAKCFQAQFGMLPNQYMEQFRNQ